MFPGKKGLFDKLLVGMSADDDELNVFVGKEVIRSLIVLGFGKVNGAMSPCLGRGRGVAWWGGSLEKCVDLKILVRKDKGEVEAFG